MERWNNEKKYCLILKMSRFQRMIFSCHSSFSGHSIVSLKGVVGFSIQTGMLLLFSKDFNVHILNTLEELGNIK